MASPRHPTAPADAAFRQGYALGACPACGALVAKLGGNAPSVTPALGLPHTCPETQERSVVYAD